MVSDFERLPPEERLAQVRQFDEAMGTRRSVREFSTDPIPVDILESAIGTAASAPSGEDRQPSHCVVVEAQNLKQRILCSAEAEERENDERWFPQEWLDDLALFETDWRNPFLEDAPWLIVVFRVDDGLDEDGRRLSGVVC